MKEVTTKEVKQVYQCFIREIIFDKSKNDDTQMTLYFDEGIVS